MWIIGVDYHPSVQQIAFTDTETGESGERRLSHSDGEAEKFYRDLKQRGISVRVHVETLGAYRIPRRPAFSSHLVSRLTGDVNSISD